jgi:hypothetical protein
VHEEHLRPEFIGIVNPVMDARLQEVDSRREYHGFEELVDVLTALAVLPDVLDDVDADLPDLRVSSLLAGFSTVVSCELPIQYDSQDDGLKGVLLALADHDVDPLEDRFHNLMGHSPNLK